MTREEATILARHIAAGAFAMHGCSPRYCDMTREGRNDESEAVQAALAALTMGKTHINARLEEIRESAEKRREKIVSIIGKHSDDVGYLVSRDIADEVISTEAA